MKSKAMLKRLSMILFVALAVSLLSLASAQAAPVWTPIATNGISAPPPTNTNLIPGEIFKSRLAVGSFASPGGGSLFTTDGSSFHKVGQTGLGNANNIAIYPYSVYRGQLYVGTGNLAQGAQLWRWSGSGSPVKLVDGGFGNVNNNEIVPSGVIDDRLILTVTNNAGMRVFAYDGDEFTQLVGQGPAGTPTGPGFGNPNNYRSIFIDRHLFKGELMIPVQNDTAGLQVFSFDGDDFVRIAHAGAGRWTSQHRIGLTAVSPVDGLLYLVAASPLPAVPAELWSYDGDDWALVDTRPAGQNVAQPLCRGDDLYLGIWEAAGCSVWKRTDPSTFSRISDPGFGDPTNNAVLLSSRNGRLLAMTGNQVTGSDVYATPVAPSIDEVVPDSGPAGTTITIEGHDFGTTRGSGSVTLNGQVFKDIVSWSDTAIKVVVPAGVSTGQVVVTTANGDSNPVVFSLTLSKTWYFAEGTTRNNAVDGTYEEWICIQNPGNAIARVSLKYMLADGSNRTQKVTVKPTSRTTVSVNGFIGPDKDVSTLVESDQLVLAERPMYFNYHGKWTGGHDVIGVPTPRSDYYFAEGTTRSNAVDGSFEEWLSLMNPGDDDAMVQVAYQLGTGTVIRRSYPVPAGSRRTVSVNAEVGPDQDVSAVVHSGTPIVAERPMYFNYHDKWTGGHDVVGAPGTDVTFYFAEGTTRNNARDGSFEEWLCLQNPGQDDSEVTITYFTSAGDSRTQKVEVPADTRVTVDVGLKLGPDVDSSVMLESSGPILAERPMYFNYHGAWDGGHDVMGCNSPAEEFYFAEGTTRAGFATWIAVLNPDTSDTQVTFDYMLGDGTTKEVSATVKAHQRYTRDVLADVGAEQDVSILVKGKVRVVAERPMYFNYHGWATGGHDTLGYGI